MTVFLTFLKTSKLWKTTDSIMDSGNYLNFIILGTLKLMKGTVMELCFSQMVLDTMGGLGLIYLMGKDG